MRALQRLFFLVTIIFLPTVAAQAQGDAKAVLRTADTQIMVGDRARVFLEASHDPSKSRIIWPQIPDSFGKLEVLEKGKIDTVKNGAEVSYRQPLFVTGFDSGVFTIPSVSVAIIPVQGMPYAISTNPLSLLVQTVAVDTTQPIRPIKDIIQVPRSWTDSLALIVGGALLIILLIIITVMYSRRKKPAPIVVEQHSRETPQHWALSALADLDHKQLWQQGEVKEYYVQLTDIVRTYIEKAYSTHAMESTTDELMDIIRRHPILRLGTMQLQGILPMADLAKFAKAAPRTEEHVAAMEDAKEFIHLTSQSLAPDTTVS